MIARTNHVTPAEAPAKWAVSGGGGGEGYPLPNRRVFAAGAAGRTGPPRAFTPIELAL